jgi:hypothetical protein
MKDEPISPDDETEGVAEELDEAATDETPTDVTAPELNAQTKDLTEWDEPPSARGTVAGKVEQDDDDETIASKLVYEGTDEADRERRMAAADPDFEP